MKISKGRKSTVSDVEPVICSTVYGLSRNLLSYVSDVFLNIYIAAKVCALNEAIVMRTMLP